MLSKAIAIAAEAFEGKKDKGGKPYILHCLRVMNDVDQNDEELMTIAVLHDLIEDCGDDYSVRLLSTLGFSERVCIALSLLTHKKDVSYDDYIKAISLNKDAREVKLSDLRDNFNICRLRSLGDEGFSLMKRYYKAFIYLSK